MCIVLTVQLKLIATDSYGANSSQLLWVYVLEVIIPVFPQYMDESYRVRLTDTQTHTHTCPSNGHIVSGELLVRRVETEMIQLHSYSC